MLVKQSMGAGAGFAQYAKKVTEWNRAVLKKSRVYDKIKKMPNGPRKEYLYKEASPEQLALIKKRLSEHNKQRNRKLLIMMSIISVLLISVAYFFLF